jgi:hypothetical protein
MHSSFSSLLSICLYNTQAARLIPAATITIRPPKSSVQSIISGRNWAYTVPFEVNHIIDINKLVQCESQGVNISRPDSNGLISDGILQFNRGPSDVLGSGAWQNMEQKFDFYGSPINPSDAIHMAGLMISAGFLRRWTYARLTRLIN